MTYTKPVKLLTTNNFKIMKGKKLGYMTYMLSMSPFTDNSKGINICPHASKGCAASCLVGSGFGGFFKGVQDGRRNKTEYFLANRVEFLAQLDKEIGLAIKRHEGKAIPTFRLNGMSDIRWEKFIVRDGKNLMELYPNVQFYDYTKNPLRFDIALPKNYQITFSRSENNHDKAIELLNRGFNVAMVFDVLPKTFEGFKVINGDETDLRFLDKKGVIVGLKYKFLTGKGADNTSAFTSGFAIMTEGKKHTNYKKILNNLAKMLEGAKEVNRVGSLINV